jgi:hypothetical protein
MYLLEVEPLDLGTDVRAVGLELTHPATQEPVRGADAARIWASTLAALAATEPWALDFFSHLDRVREYCARHSVVYREAASRCIVIPALAPQPLAALLQRFEAETFGVRAGEQLAGDAALEADLSRRGVDAYHRAFQNYLFCAVCDFENGFLTLLTQRLWATEVVRRATPAVHGFAVEVRLPR